VLVVRTLPVLTWLAVSQDAALCACTEVQASGHSREHCGIGR